MGSAAERVFAFASGVLDLASVPIGRTVSTSVPIGDVVPSETPPSTDPISWDPRVGDALLDSAF